MLAQAALAHFMNDGSFARHIRKMNRVYRERHEMVKNAISQGYADHLKVIPSMAGLHMAAVARFASSKEIDRILHRAAERSVAVQSLSRFAVDATKRSGLLVGYGAIATPDIQEGLRRLRECFDE
jgi:GntR family transcriptional regulator / MocR family aminotransferase